MFFLLTYNYHKLPINYSEIIYMKKINEKFMENSRKLYVLCLTYARLHRNIIKE